MLYASPTGMKVTVKAANGAVLAEHVDLDELRSLDPHLHDLFRSGVARRGPYLDATLDSRLRPAGTGDEPVDTKSKRGH